MPHRHWIRTCALALGLALTAPLVMPATAGATQDAGDIAAPTPPAFDAELRDRFDQALITGMGDRPGGAVAAVWSPGKGEWIGTLGKANLSTGRMMTAAVQSPIGSITKTVTATLVLQEVQKGTIRLPDPVSTWYPDVPLANEITVEMLLNMSSGIGDYLNDRIVEFATEMLADPARRYDPDTLIEIGAALPRAFAVPGTAYSYSNTNTTILGRILEKVTGRSYGELVRTRVLAPLGMDRTTVNFAGRLQAPFTQTYSVNLTPLNGRDLTPTTRWSSSWAYAAGALASTIADLGTWGTVLGTGTGVLSKQTQRLRLNRCSQITPPGAPVDARYCLGAVVMRDPATGSITSIWHNGAVVGAAAYVGYYPRTGSVVAVLVNTDAERNGQSGAMEIAARLQDAAPRLLGAPT